MFDPMMFEAFVSIAESFQPAAPVLSEIGVSGADAVLSYPLAGVR